jgi:hypothetical protein
MTKKKIDGSLAPGDTTAHTVPRYARRRVVVAADAGARSCEDVRRLIHQATAHHAIRRSWLTTIQAAIQLGECDVVYRLTVGYVRRLREVGIVLWRG